MVRNGAGEDGGRKGNLIMVLRKFSSVQFRSEL